MRTLLIALAALLFMAPWPSYAQTVAGPPTTALSITVQAGARQSFQGFGASAVNYGHDYNALTPGQRKQLCDLLWRGLHFKILRLWFNTDLYSPRPGIYDMTQFCGNYVDSGIIADALKSGVTTLLLAPSGLPPYLAEKNSDGSAETGMALIPADSDTYADLLADFLERLKAKTGIVPNITGVENEPNDNDRFTPAELVETVKRLRSDLNRQGMSTVKIIATENANADGSFYAQLDALKADPAAWNDLSGIASHSYNMAATEQAADYIAGTDKSYWMTEASANGPEAPGDALQASSLASRFLNDMNHRVTHWVHFIGFEVADPHDNATRIIAYNRSPFSVTIFQKYYYYEQLSRAFDIGAVFRHSVSSLDGEMTYTYGKKPRLNAAAARNPDGSWSIGLSNYTDASFSDNTTGNDLNTGYSAQTFDATITIPELAKVKSLRFEIRRSNSGVDDIAEGDAIMHYGVVAVNGIAPLDLITLRSARK